jgi:hypothetical protein
MREGRKAFRFLMQEAGTRGRTQEEEVAGRRHNYVCMCVCVCVWFPLPCSFVFIFFCFVSLSLYFFPSSCCPTFAFPTFIHLRSRRSRFKKQSIIEGMEKYTGRKRTGKSKERESEMMMYS